MKTGVWCDVHKVTDNSFKNSELANIKSFYSYIEDFTGLKPRTAVLHSWEPISTDIYESWPGTADILEMFPTDDPKARDRAIDLLKTDENIDIIYLHLRYPDTFGHIFGFNTDVPEYSTAV
jgi:hypothetical protein